MRRSVTFSLVVLTVFLWAASLWRLSARVTGMDLVYAGIPAGLALLLLIGFAVSGRIFNPNDNVRRVFSAVLAVTLLLTIGLVYADIFVFSGEIFERGLAIWRLDIFYQERFAYTLAFAGGAVHDPVGSLLLCSSPQAAFTVVNGRVVVREGRLTTVEMEPLIGRHNRLAMQLAEARNNAP